MIVREDRRLAVRFALTVALPLLLASAAVALLTTNLISMVSDGANTLEHGHAVDVVNSALEATRRQLANTVDDNARWDDAVRHLYGAPDEAWLAETFGSASQDGIVYDAVMVADGERGILAGLRRGLPFAPAADYFKGELAPLIGALPAGDTSYAARAEILETLDGPAFVAAATILPTSDELAVPSGRHRHLVMLQFLTPERVDALGDQYVLDDLRLVEGETDEGLALHDFAGHAVARLQWTADRPGDVAKSAVTRTAIKVFAFFAIVMGGIAFFCWRLLRQVAAGEASARHDALHDPLTGLGNRAAAYATVERRGAKGENVAVAFADLDGFRDVNNTYDHATGDRLLALVAGGLPLLDRHAEVCRLGGDEFVAVMTGPHAEERAKDFAGKLIEWLSEPLNLDGRIATIGASVGIAATAGEAIDAQELMRRADIAMYKAKAAGKNRLCAYRSEFDAERYEDLEIARELRRIIAEGSIDIAYQPVVDAATAAIVAVEGLARWPADSSRRPAPDRFIRVAETHGIIDDLGDAILTRACADAVQWPSLRLALNISPVQLRNPAFTRRVLDRLRQSGIDHRRMELEITESVLVDDLPRAKRVFAELRAAGIGIALDDFGVGFSSIGYLRQLEFDRIKIDRSLVERLLSGMNHVDIVHGTALLASGLAARVTAEGVERPEQANALRLCGCTELQGHHFYPALPPAEISRLVAAEMRPAATAA